MRIWILATLALLAMSTAAFGEVTRETVVYEHDGTVLEGYLARPAISPQVDLPAVIVVHAWMGVNDYVKHRADMLAELGYIAFAADIYGQGVRPTNPQEAGAEAGKYRGDRELLRGRLQAALDRLREMPQVDEQRIAAIGYCFGGGAVIEMARMGAPLRGVVSFHGSLTAGEGMQAQPGAVNAEVLVLHGAADPHVPWADVVALASELDHAGAAWQLVAYSGAMHSFTEPSANNPEGGSMYDATADARSWEDMQQFFADIGLAP